VQHGIFKVLVRNNAHKAVRNPADLIANFHFRFYLRQVAHKQAAHAVTVQLTRSGTSGANGGGGD